jgi:hypothetical protein
VNRDFYPEPLRATCASGDTVTLEDEEASTKAILAMTGEKGGDEKALQSEIAVLAQNDKQREAFLRTIAAKMAQGLETSANEYAARDVRAKILPLPGFLRRLITRNLTRLLLRDVNDFLFSQDRRGKNRP